MSDDALAQRLREFVEERDWNQFHSPANLAKSILIEGGELLEHFQWSDDRFDVDEVKNELADVLTYCYLLAFKLDLDPQEIIIQKLEQTREKYPADLSRGKSTKYNKLTEEQ